MIGASLGRAVRVGLLAALLLAPVAGIARAQGTAGEWPALIKRYEQQVARAPGDPQARFTLAMLYARDGRLLEGYNHLQAADQATGGPSQRAPVVRQIVGDAEGLLRSNPSDLLARYRLAFARFFLGDHGGAMNEMQRIIAVEPRNDWAWGYLGAGYSTLGQTDRAIAAWERGLAINPKNAALHYVLGLSYAKKGDKKKAAAHFAAAYRDRTLYEYVTRGNR